MATTRNVTYKQYNGTDWDTVYFKTAAGLVGETGSTGLVFLRPSTHLVNGKSFMNGTTHVGITLYGSDIKVDSYSDALTITEMLDRKLDTTAQAADSAKLGGVAASNYATQTWVSSNYASSGHNHDLTYLHLDKLLDYTEINSYDALNQYINGENNEVLTATAIYNVLGSFSRTSHTHSVATTSADGFMSATDKTNLNTLVALLNDNDSDTTINTIREVLNAFSTMTEGTDLANVLAGKLDKSGGTITGELEVESLVSEGSISSSGSIYGATLYEGGTSLSNKYQAKGSYASASHTHDERYLSLSGGTVSGELEVESLVSEGSISSSGSIYGATLYEGGTSLSNKYQAKGSYASASHTHSNYCTVFTGSTTPSSPKTGDVWLYY